MTTINLVRLNGLGLVGALIVGLGTGYTGATASGITDWKKIATASLMGALVGAWGFFVQRTKGTNGEGTPILPGLTTTDTADAVKQILPLSARGISADTLAVIRDAASKALAERDATMAREAKVANNAKADAILAEAQKQAALVRLTGIAPIVAGETE